MEQWNFYVARHIADTRKKKCLAFLVSYVILCKAVKMKLQTFFTASGAVKKS
jgi:hypothetical protein